MTSNQRNAIILGTLMGAIFGWMGHVAFSSLILGEEYGSGGPYQNMGSIQYWAEHLFPAGAGALFARYIFK